MAYGTIHTNYGLAQLAKAESTGVQVLLVSMAVGDGNGNETTPKAAQTTLVRERYRSAISRVYQSPNDPQRFTAELVVPATTGGFTMREIGIFDSAGSLFAVGNLPATYKPLNTEGAYSDAVIKVEFMVSNADSVVLMADPNVAVASQQWIKNNITAATIIPGGTTGQYLAKKTNTDGDVFWVNPADVSVRVDTIFERQTLAANQVIVDLTKTTTYGLAVYVNGLRVPQGTGTDEWAPHATITTRLTLGKSYAAGSVFQAVNNEPAGSAPAPLEKSKNLADIPNVATALTNLGVYNKTETRQMAPAGLVASFSRSTAPAGWLKANGAAISRTAYADLFAALGTRHGAGDGFNTFNLPDLRGEFVRGWDDARGIDSGRVLGSMQEATWIQPNVETNDSATAIPTGNTERSFNTTETGGLSSIQNIKNNGSRARAYIRPRNVSLLYCIKI